MTKSLISVIISVYNDESNISKAIESLLNQTYQNIEILIVDDCSEDSTYQICKNYEKIYPNKISVYKNSKNIGLTKSLNILIKKSKGEYIARQDSDDISFDTRFEKQIKTLKSKKIDVCYSRAFRKSSKKVIPGISFYIPRKWILKIKNPFIHGTMLCKSEVLKKIGGYDEEFYYSQDYKLILNFIKYKFRVSILKEPLYELNMENNISSNFKDQQRYYADCAKRNKTPDINENIYK
jgi:glycosyltransferase involved in cell wall biosynthesis